MAFNLVIVGFGGMGSWHYENITARIPEIKVTGAYDVREEALQNAAAKGLHTYGSLDEVLNDKSVDIVTVATPNDFHKDIAISCMRAGKNVISEKPVTLNSKELEEIISVSKETGKLFSIHQNRRWDEDYMIIKKIVDDNLLGKPYAIESKVQGSRRSLHGWRGHKVNGGGMLLDWGVHLLDQVIMLINSPVVSVYANLFEVYSDEVDDNCRINLAFENGTTALIEVATNCFINLPRWHVQFEDGTAVIEDWSCKGRMVKLSSSEIMEWSEDIVYTKAGPTRTMAPRPPETTEQIDLPKVEGDWSCYYKNIAEVLEGKAELIVKPEQALRVMKVIDNAFKSSEIGESIKCRI